MSTWKVLMTFISFLALAGLFSGPVQGEEDVYKSPSLKLKSNKKAPKFKIKSGVWDNKYKVQETPESERNVASDEEEDDEPDYSTDRQPSSTGDKAKNKSEGAVKKSPADHVSDPSPKPWHWDKK